MPIYNCHPINGLIAAHNGMNCLRDLCLRQNDNFVNEQTTTILVAMSLPCTSEATNEVADLG